MQMKGRGVWMPDGNVRYFDSEQDAREFYEAQPWHPMKQLIAEQLQRTELATVPSFCYDQFVELFFQQAEKGESREVIKHMLVDAIVAYRRKGKGKGKAAAQAEPPRVEELLQQHRLRITKNREGKVIAMDTAWMTGSSGKGKGKATPAQPDNLPNVDGALLADAATGNSDYLIPPHVMMSGGGASAGEISVCAFSRVFLNLYVCRCCGREQPVQHARWRQCRGTRDMRRG